MKANVIPCVKKSGQSNKHWKLIYANYIFHTTPDTFDLNDTRLETSTVEGFMSKVLRYKDAIPKVVETDIINGLFASGIDIEKNRIGTGGNIFAGFIPRDGYNLFLSRFEELCEHTKFNPGTNLRDIAPLIAAWQSYAL